MRMTASFGVMLILVGFIVFFVAYRKRDRVNLTETSVQTAVTSLTLILYSTCAGFIGIYNYYQLWSNYQIMFSGRDFNIWIALVLISGLGILFLPIISFVIFVTSKRRLLSFDEDSEADEQTKEMIGNTVASACRKMNISNVPIIRFSITNKASIRIIPYKKNTSILLIPSDILSIIDNSIRVFEKSKTLKHHLLEYLIRHELSHLYNKDMLIYPLLRWFEKAGSFYIYSIIAMMLIFFAVDNTLLRMLNIYFICVSIPLVMLSILYLVYCEVIERKREYFADIRAILNSSDNLKENLLTQQKIMSNSISSPFENLARTFSSSISGGFENKAQMIYAQLNTPIKSLCTYLSDLIYPEMSHAQRRQAIINWLESPQKSILPQKDIMIMCGGLVAISYFFYSFIFEISLPSTFLFEGVIKSALVVVLNLVLAISLIVVAWDNISDIIINDVSYKRLVIQLAYYFLALFATMTVVLVMYSGLEIAIDSKIATSFWAILGQITFNSLSFVFIYLLGIIFLKVMYENALKLNNKTTRIFVITVLSLFAQMLSLWMLFGHLQSSTAIFSISLFMYFLVIYSCYRVPGILFDWYDNIVFLKIFTLRFYYDELKSDVNCSSMISAMFINVYVLLIFTVPLAACLLMGKLFFELLVRNAVIPNGQISLIIALPPMAWYFYIIYKQKNLKPSSYLNYLYYKYLLLEIFKIDPGSLLQKNTAKFIESIKSKSGGYHFAQKKIISYISSNTNTMWTYYKVYQISERHKNVTLDRSRIRYFENIGGGFGNQDCRFPRIEFTSKALEIISGLGLQNFDLELHSNWLLACYREDGYFTEYLHNKPILENSYFALAGLEILGLLGKLPNLDVIAKSLSQLWRDSRQSEELAFYYVKSLLTIGKFASKAKLDITELWINKTSHILRNTRFDKHYERFYYFLKVQELIGYEDDSIRDIVVKALEEEDSTIKNPEAT